MELGHVQASRPNYFDRNPASTILAYSTEGVAPHGTTQRWIHTVATGKKAYVEAASCQVTRRGAAAPAATVQNGISILPGGTGATQIIAARIFSNAVSDDRRSVLSGVGFLTSGDAISCNTADTSTGGTVDYLGSCKLTEFDA